MRDVRRMLIPVATARSAGENVSRCESKGMNREQIIATLRTHESELKAAGVLSVSVFGSIGRGDAGKDSDIDVAVRLGEGFSLGGFDYFGRLEELERRLSLMLGCKVDVVE